MTEPAPPAPVVTAQEFADLEHLQFGGNEFTPKVAGVASIEQSLGIYDLNHFMPEVLAFTPHT